MITAVINFNDSICYHGLLNRVLTIENFLWKLQVLLYYRTTCPPDPIRLMSAHCNGRDLTEWFASIRVNWMTTALKGRFRSLNFRDKLRPKGESKINLGRIGLIRDPQWRDVVEK
jgi:hypothetical protein